LPSEVRDNKDQHRFELAVDGRTAFSQYKLSPGVITFMHTEVPKELEGHGVGSSLVRGELEAVRAQGLKVVAKCPFVAAYIKKHPEFQDLLA
jgi:predicted GNAT family acetyltransferase